MPNVAELSALVGGTFDPQHAAVPISGPAALAEAQAGEISFFGHPRYASDLRTTQAAAVLVPQDFDGETPAACIRVENPSSAFTVITQQFIRPPATPAPGCHSSAVIAPDAVVSPEATIQACAVIESGAEIGPRTVIGAGCYVGAGAKIGADVFLHPRVMVREACVIGDRVIIHCGAVVGSDGFGYDTKDGRHTKIPQIGHVVIGHDVEIGANTTIDRARFGRTVIGEGTKIDNQVMIAHNVVIGRHCIICAQVGISGSTQVGDHVILAGQAGLVGHIKVGSGSIVGAQSGLSNDLPPKSIVVGSPPRPIGEWKRSIVRIDRLPELYARVKKLEQERA